MVFFISVLQTFSEILTAGIAITAFSLLIYALTFNLRDRVARSFAFIMACVAVVFAGEALSSVSTGAIMAGSWLRLQWIGLVFIPAAYLHFSDALLETTGQPSRGRRRNLVRLTYLISFGFLLTLPFSFVVGGAVIGELGILRFQSTPLTWVFIVFYAGGVSWAWVNLLRAYRRTVTATGLRRMRYLLTGAIAPALGSFPYLMFGAGFVNKFPAVFWFAVIFINVILFIFLVAMAYAVAFFGVSWPDRVVKRRLAKWLMRGPVTAFVVLGLTTVVRRTEQFFGLPETVVVPVVMVITILVMEHWISLAAPVWERWLFNPGDQDDLRLLQTLEERLLTTGDLRQFLEGILAAVCDQFQVTTAFIAATGAQGVEV
ncbi:MAG TPA: histidine kinase N-terminal 7TM domain-containing protein, partial [Anaerolineales bacterium]|nr:histidine kinase N-terminal 7TM domain-containing protein [Anaerolineales bacterium]